MQQKPSEAAADQHGNPKGNGVTFCPQFNHHSFVELEGTEKLCKWLTGVTNQTQGKYWANPHPANKTHLNFKRVKSASSNANWLECSHPHQIKPQVYSQKLTLFQAVPMCCQRKAGHWGKNQTRSQGFELYLFVQLVPGADPSTLLAKTPTKPKMRIKLKGSPKPL